MSVLGLVGYGKMGQAIEKLASNNSAITKVNIFRQGDDIKSFVRGSDFFIDFSSSDGAEILVGSLLETTPKPTLIGTTNLSASCKEKIALLAEKTSVMVAPNVSIASNLQALVSQKIASILGASYKADIVDIHHIHKKDAPSGTALMLKEFINKGFEQKIEISSIREGEVIGEHIVNFHGNDDSLTITHKVENRELFARGAISAILWLAKQKPENYTMQDMLKI